MFRTEQYELSEHEIAMIIQEAVSDPKNSDLRDKLIDPIFEKLKNLNIKKSYIEYGSRFIELNSDMLVKEYPSKQVSFPKKYVDSILELFGFTLKSMEEILIPLLKAYSGNDYYDMKISSNPTNVLHAIVVYYSDLSLNHELRDSARQQLGLTLYSNRYNVYFKNEYDEGVMAYTYMQLNRSWRLVKSENVVTWIGMIIDGVYACWRTRMTVNMSINIIFGFLIAARNAFNQDMKQLSQKYHINLTEKNSAGKDITDDTDYVITNNFTKIRNNILRKIKNGDNLYKNKSNLYTGIAKLKNVKCDSLYDFAQKIDYSDITDIIDGIFYVFIVKEGNAREDINSIKYMSRITNLPTAVDRAVSGKPIILPLSKKYNVKSNIVIAYICLIATYIMQRIEQD